MDKLITKLEVNSIIGQAVVKFRPLTEADFDLAEVRADDWVKACWKGSPGISKNWPRSASVTKVLALKPELIAELMTLDGRDETKQLFADLVAQFERYYRTREINWKIYPGPCMQLDYRGCKKEDTARGKYEAAMAAAHEKLPEVVAKNLEALNRGFESIANAVNQRFQEQALRVYADPESWKPVKNSEEFAARRAEIDEAEKKCDEMRAELRRARGTLAKALFEEYLTDNEEGASSLSDQIRDAIRERLDNPPSSGHFIRIGG